MATAQTNAPGSAFSAGWNLLTTDPAGFFSVLTGGGSFSDKGATDAANKLPAPEVKQVVQDSKTGFGASFGAGFSELTTDPLSFAGDTAQVVTEQVNKAAQPLFNIPTWAKFVVVGGLIVGGIVAVGVVIHEFKKV